MTRYEKMQNRVDSFESALIRLDENHPMFNFWVDCLNQLKAKLNDLTIQEAEKII